MTGANCQGCATSLSSIWIDLGMSPLANSNVSANCAHQIDRTYPLRALVCGKCFLVQVPPVVPANEIFNEDYAYFSSYSESWLRHCQAYVADMTTRFVLGENSQVVEIASNDGYMLQYFVERGVPVLGVEPSRNTAEVAIAKGIPTEIRFFGAETARDLVARGFSADLLAAKNVMAHVPDINDFVGGVATILKPDGVFTVEFPHILNTIRFVQFDQIYHEHYTYLSLIAVQIIFVRHSLRVFDVTEQTTHGGSLRVFACRIGASHEMTANVNRVLDDERSAQLDQLCGYAEFDARVQNVRANLNAFLAQARNEGKSVAGYGAAAKGNTLINYCGLGVSDISMIADRSAAKQGMLAPGSHIPIVSPGTMLAAKPDFVLILPWNLAAEIKTQMAEIRGWGGRFVTAIPTLEIE